MLGKVKQVLSGRFVRNVITVASGTAGAQMITLAFIPFITRMYGPETLGLLGTFMAIVSVLMPMAALTFPMAIVLPKSNADAKGLAKLSVFVALFTSTFTALILFLLGDWIAVSIGSKEIGTYMMLIPLAMLLSALHQVFEQWVMRLKLFSVAAKSALTQSVILNSAKVGIGVFYPAAMVLVVLQTLASALYATLLWIGIKRALPDGFIFNESPTSSKDLALRYRDFAIYRAPQVTINAASQSLPVLMLAYFFGPAAAGFYALGKTVVGVPSTLLGKAVGDVLYPRISEAANNKEDLYPLVKKATILLAIVGVFPFSIVIIFGPWLFALIFGIEWEVAGEYARWLSIWMFFMYLNNPAVKAIPILSAQGYHLMFTIVTIILRVLVLYVGYYYFSSDGVAIALFGVLSALLNLVLIISVLIMCKQYDRREKGDGQIIRRR